MIAPLPPELMERIKEIAKKICPTTESPGMMLIVRSYIETAETAILAAYPLIAAYEREKTAKLAAEICREEMLCPEDEKYDNEIAVKIGEGTVYNKGMLRCAEAIERELTGGKDEKESQVQN